ncbi:glucose-6-phosphate dehydrogenase, partial [Candidatus Pacearchaeota archaeon]|nr:glucose-6-phosphate dehydrogenase [Candidatus Pacearchaeota archaeon]
MEDNIFILFGATGDLAKKKLIPALYNLYVKGHSLPIICVSRRIISKAEYIRLLDLDSNVKNLNKEKLKGFLKNLQYIEFDLQKGNSKDLGNKVINIVQGNNLKGNMIFYLAISPLLFNDAVKSIKNSGLLKKKGYKRIAFEKPFGEDLKSAKEINRNIKKVFREKEIFRIDHFLGKELVQNISVLRFTNSLLKPQWNNKFIDHVQITLSENFGVEGRGNFYDKYGAIKDVVQNHMLQIFSLIAMEEPKKLLSNDIRNEKIKVLKKVEKIKGKNVVQGQYKGYKKVGGVGKNSKTETFAAIKFFVDNKRWKNAPFYFLTGKNMKRNLVTVLIQFKKAKCLLFEDICDFGPNHLLIEVQPREGFHININAKSPGKENIEPIEMNFCHKCKFGPETPEAYENLFLDIIKGDQSTFVRTDEIEESWKIVDGIKKNKLYHYKKGSYPKEADK